jgi:hypothetical protein
LCLGYRTQKVPALHGMLLCYFVFERAIAMVGAILGGFSHDDDPSWLYRPEEPPECMPRVLV